MTNPLLQKAIVHVSAMVTCALEHAPPERALVVFDEQAGLTQILTEAYRATLPHATFMSFDSASKSEVIAAFNDLHPRDLVVLIQSASFRLDEFRIRLHLFEKGLKVIEHTYLRRNTEENWGTYINALAYDPSWYRTMGPALKTALEHTQELRITTNGAELTVVGGLESPKMNIGDYTGMKNVGGSFPIGEVFTEARDFAAMNGSVMLYGFAGPDFCMNRYEPFRVDIVHGLIAGWGTNTPPAFVDVISAITARERPLVREIGFGLNRAISRAHPLEDIGAFERNLGLHLSIGEKHSVYKKPGIHADKCRFHVDVFPVVDTVTGDGAVLFSAGQYTPPVPIAG